MRLLAVLALVAACASTAPSAPALDDVFERPEGTLPFRFSFSADGGKVAYLLAREADGLTDLWLYDIESKQAAVALRAEGEQRLSAAERAARERRRERTRGVSRYWLNPRDDSILLVRSGDLFRLRNGTLDRLTATEAPERQPRWSPDGAAVAYVRGRNLYVWRDGSETALTTEGGGSKACGLAEFIAMEELGRHEGFWWSRDGQRLAYAVTDAARVPSFAMHDYLAPTGRTVAQDYPRAGDTNVSWSLRVVPVAGGDPVEMRVEGEYLVRVDWMPDGALAVQTSDRAQRELTLSRCDPETGAATVLLVERDDAWVRFHRNLRFLADGRFLWTSERSGRNHLYLVGAGGPRALTRGDWDVAGVVALDEEKGVVFFTAGRRNGRERHLYRVGLDGSGRRRLTQEAGWHGIAASKDARWLLDTASRVGAPPRITLRDAEGDAHAELARGKPVPGLPAPEWVTIPAADGTELSGVLYRARRHNGPALIHCYGGPNAHLVNDRWGGATYLWHMRMVAKGYTILTVDGRGSGGYGRAFSRVVSGRLCDWEVKDQAAAARWLGGQPEVDPARIGIWGWSYGGTLTLMCLLHAPDAFAAGVAVAPVTDWRDYDTAYTERYLGLPQHNGDAYDLSSPITRADTLDRPLLLAHGMMDDNVHFRGAVAFLDKAQRAGRRIETDFYPRGAHGIGGKRERKLLFARMEDFWARTLGR